MAERALARSRQDAAAETTELDLHRLVAELGGKAVDTDYILWSKPTQLGPT